MDTWIRSRHHFILDNPQNLWVGYLSHESATAKLNFYGILIWTLVHPSGHKRGCGCTVRCLSRVGAAVTVLMAHLATIEAGAYLPPGPRTSRGIVSFLVAIETFQSGRIICWPRWSRTKSISRRSPWSRSLAYIS